MLYAIISRASLISARAAACQRSRLPSDIACKITPDGYIRSRLFHDISLNYEPADTQAVEVDEAFIAASPRGSHKCRRYAMFPVQRQICH